MLAVYPKEEVRRRLLAWDKRIVPPGRPAWDWQDQRACFVCRGRATPDQTMGFPALGIRVHLGACAALVEQLRPHRSKRRTLAQLVALC